MNKFLIAIIFSVFAIGAGNTQSVEEEIEFKYIKAKYLLDTERYEDAIKAFTAIIKEKEDFSDALVLRAKSKYAMAAYKGTKKDILLFASSNGLNAEALTLLGKADYRMKNNDAALNSLSVVGELGSEDTQIFEFIGNLYEEKDEMKKACAAWQKAASMGSSKASIKAKKECGRFKDKVVVTKPKKTPKPDGKLDTSTLPTKSNKEKASSDEVDNESPKANDRTPEQKRRDADNSLNQTTRENTPTQQDEIETAEEEPIEEGTNSGNMPGEDNSPNEIEIDEDLTLVISGQGLGKRKVLDQPNILILAEDGIVAIDICVNKRGKVESAEFNSKLSTLAKKSLISLAIRKSKDFWFEKNDYKEQCGVILFKIEGS